MSPWRMLFRKLRTPRCAVVFEELAPLVLIQFFFFNFFPSLHSPPWFLREQFITGYVFTPNRNTPLPYFSTGRYLIRLQLVDEQNLVVYNKYLTSVDSGRNSLPRPHRGPFSMLKDAFIDYYFFCLSKFCKAMCTFKREKKISHSFCSFSLGFKSLWRSQNGI